jgi:phage antirepressor YoqD-like protein
MKKLDTAVIEFAPGFRRRFTNAPISMDFRHTLSADSPKITENYHISWMRSDYQYGYIFRANVGIRNRLVSVFVDEMVLKSSRTTIEDTARLIGNNQIQDFIQQNKPILYAELMQWANQANFGEVR